MKKNIFFFIVAAVLLACNIGTKKKVLIMSKGDITIKDNAISIEDANNYAEKEMDLPGGKVTLQVTSAAGNFSVDITDNGYYILNVRKDTIVGSYQRIGIDLSSADMMTIEQLKVKIDSLHKLMGDSNVTLQNRNYFIAPAQLQKITNNTNAMIVGPFRLIPGSLEPGPDGKAPELYKFFTSAEMRDMIEKLTKVTKGEN